MDMVTPPKIPESRTPAAIAARGGADGHAAGGAWRRGDAFAAADVVGRRSIRRWRKRSQRSPRPMPASSACGCRKIQRNISAARRRSAARPCAARVATGRSPSIRRTSTSRSRWRARCLMRKGRRRWRCFARPRRKATPRPITRSTSITNRGTAATSNRMPLVTRAEADRALHKAAELGHPFSTQMLAILLDRGTTVKRDPVAARYWAGRAVANPARDASTGEPAGAARTPPGDVRQTGGARPRARHPRTNRQRPAVRRQARTGDCDPQGRTGARANAARGSAVARPRRRAATAGRNADRGRRRPGGPQARAVAAQKRTDTAGVKGVLGRLYLEGKLVPRDPQKAARLFDQAGAWDLDARTEVLQILAANPKSGSRIPSTCSTTPPRPRNWTSPARWPR